MRNIRLFTICFTALVILIFQGSTIHAAPLRTAFTYSGMLMDSNVPADGLYDFSFGLFDADVNGLQLGSDVNVPIVNVIDGLFKAELDFGSGIFTGQATWLEICIRKSAEEELDQQQDNFVSLCRTPNESQSFTPAISGFLTKVEIYGMSPLGDEPSPGTLEIHEGEGIGGALLVTEDVTWTVDLEWKTFTFSRPAYLTSGNTYTLRIIVPVEFPDQAFFLGFSDTNPYPGGKMFGWSDPNHDLVFKTYMVSDEGEYTQLSPREEIITVPNAQYAMLADYALLAETVQIPLILEGDVASPNSVIMGINTGTGGGVYGRNNGNEGYLGTTSYGVYGIGSMAGYFQGDTHVTGNFTVDGRVGVGTTTPKTQLNITKTLTIGANSNYEAPTGGGSNLELRYRTDGGLDTAEIISYNRSDDMRRQIRIDGDPIILRPGFVGIGPKFGTTVPTYELEVEGTIKGDYFNGVPWSSPQFVISPATLGQRAYLVSTAYKYTVPFDIKIQGVIISANHRANNDSFAVNLYIDGIYTAKSNPSNIADYGSAMQAFEEPITVSAGQVIYLTCGEGNGVAQLAAFLYGRYNESTPAD